MSVRQIDRPSTLRRRLPPASHRRLPACAQARAAIEEQKSVASHWMRSCKQAACPDRKGRRLTQRTCMAPLESPPPNLSAGAGRRAEAGRRAGRAQHCPPLAPLLVHVHAHVHAHAHVHVHVGHVGAAGRRTGWGHRGGAGRVAIGLNARRDLQLWTRCEHCTCMHGMCMACAGLARSCSSFARSWVSSVRGRRSCKRRCRR